MQGVSVITDSNGHPAVLTIDLHRLNPTDRPLVTALLNRLRIEPLIYEMAETIEQEREEVRLFAHTALNRAYGEDEPDYDDVPALNLSVSHE